MVGDGPDRVAAEEEARTLGVEHDVQFLGRIQDVAPLLVSADLFVLTTDRESFGLSALESLACGAPVIAYDAGGVREVVKDGVSGALRPVGDIDAMAAAACDILGDPARWQTMSDAGVADARARFSSDQIVAEYEALYQSVLT